MRTGVDRARNYTLSTHSDVSVPKRLLAWFSALSLFLCTFVVFAQTPRGETGDPNSDGGVLGVFWIFALCSVYGAFIKSKFSGFMALGAFAVFSLVVVLQPAFAEMVAGLTCLLAFGLTVYVKFFDRSGSRVTRTEAPVRRVNATPEPIHETKSRAERDGVSILSRDAQVGALKVEPPAPLKRGRVFRCLNCGGDVIHPLPLGLTGTTCISCGVVSYLTEEGNVIGAKVVSRCPNCRQKLRYPGGRENELICPKCKTSFRPPR